MKKDKELKKIAEKSLSEYENKEFEIFLSQQAEVLRSGKNEAVVRRSFSLRYIAYLCAVMCLVLGLGLGIGFAINNNGVDPLNFFGESERVVVDIQLNEINEYTTYIDFVSGSNTKKTIDSITNEVYNYQVSYDDTNFLFDFNFEIFTKSEYVEEKYQVDYNKTLLIDELNVSLSENFDLINGIYFFNGVAKIETDKEIVCVKYSYMSIDENSKFEEYLRECTSL